MKNFKDYLIETFETNSVDTTSDDYFQRSPKLPRDSPTSGSYGYVELDDTKPHTVNKKPHDPFGKAENRDDDWDDAYYVYIKYIVDNKLAQENPYFPRVFKFETKKDPNQKIMYDIELEKLNMLNSLSVPEVKLLGQRIFGEAFEKASTNPGFIQDMAHGYRTYKHLFAGFIEECVRGYTKSNDPLLNEAAKILITLKYKNTYLNFDLHEGNFMFRRNKFGVQIVITDPFS